MSGLFLIVDITDFSQLAVVLWDGEKIIQKFWKKLPGRHLNILWCLVQLFKQAKVGLKSLSGLVLLEGTGSFSNTRQAAAILNTICLVKQIPVLGLDKRKFGEGWKKIMALAEKDFKKSKRVKFIKPIYNNEPRITCPTI